MKLTEKTQSEGQGQYIPKVGTWCGELISVNPSAEEVAKIYESDKVSEKEPEYQGKTKVGDKDWSMLRLIFKTNLGDIVEYRQFLSNEINEWGEEPDHKIEFVSCTGDVQIVSDAKNLWESTTHFQKWDDGEKKWVAIAEKSYKKCHKGEGELYTLLHYLIKTDHNNPETDIFIPFKDLMAGKVKEIKSLIGTENLNSVCGVSYVEIKDGEDGKKNYNQNCIGKAWAPGADWSKLNVLNSSNSWGTIGKDWKMRPLKNMYYHIQKCKHVVSTLPLHEMTEADSIAVGDKAISHSSEPVTDADY